VLQEQHTNPIQRQEGNRAQDDLSGERKPPAEVLAAVQKAMPFYINDGFAAYNSTGPEKAVERTDVELFVGIFVRCCYPLQASELHTTDVP
jgi:hypothetical protein